MKTLRLSKVSGELAWDQILFAVILFGGAVANPCPVRGCDGEEVHVGSFDLSIRRPIRERLDAKRARRSRRRACRAQRLCDASVTHKETAP